jgi:hypothetical protein
MENPKNTTDQPSTGASPVAEIRRNEDFTAQYANHLAVESNSFDLKIIFGLYDHQAAPKAAVDQFASMNIPWAQVKLLIFFLQLHIDGYESENGKIHIPANALPLDLPALPPALDNPKGRQAVERFRKMRNEFIASQKDQKS